jgi:hypothetical protein
MDDLLKKWKAPLSDAWQRAEAALEAANQDFSETGRLRRIYVNDQLADAHYRLHDLLKARGETEAANAAHSRANAHWGKVQEELAEDAPPPAPKYELK